MFFDVFGGVWHAWKVLGAQRVARNNLELANGCLPPSYIG